MSKRLNIVHIIVRLETGGTERSLQRLIEATLGEFNHSVICIGFPTSIGAGIAELGVAVHYLDYRYQFNWLRIRGVVRAQDPNLAQGWMYYGNVVASLLFGRDDVPCLWNIRHAHGSAPEKLSLRLALWMGARLSRSKVVFNSQAARRTHDYLGYDQPEAVVIPNGIDANHFRASERIRTEVRTKFGLSPPSRWIGFVARNHSHKGIDIFLAAVALLLATNQSWCIVLAGPGMIASDGITAESGVKKQIEELGIAQEQITLCDRIDDTAFFFPALDCLVVPSRVESFPNVAIEAMACEVPVVGTDVGDLSVIVDDPERICPVADVTALRLLIANIMRQPREALAERAKQDRQRVRARYHMDLSSQAYVSLYRTLTQPAPMSGPN